MYGSNTPNAMRMLAMLHSANQAPVAPPKPIRQTKAAPTRRRAPTPPSESESESEQSYSESDLDSVSSYEDVDTIYKRVVEEKKCPRVSPAGLKAKKTSREAIEHLKKKECPEVPSLKKQKTVSVAEQQAESPKAPKKTARRTTAKKAKTEPTPAPVAEPTPAPQPAAAATQATKAKRAPSAYNKFVSEQRKAGKSMSEAAAAWRDSRAQTGGQ